MTSHLTPGRQALLFTVLVMALGLAFTPLVQAMGEPGLILYMFTPTMVTLVMLFAVTKDGLKPGVSRELGLRPSGKRYWAFAAATAVAVSVVGLLVALTVSSAHFTTPHRWYLLPIDLVIEIVAASLTMCLGEELGWRGYLLPRLRHLGDAKAMAIVGVIHGTWHMPIILGTSVHYIDGDRWIIVPLFYLTIIGGGFFFGLLRIYSGSVWPASIAHAAHNAAWSFTGSFMVATGFTAGSYVAGDVGIVIAAGVWLGAGGLWLWHNRRSKTRTVSEPKTGVALSA